jgi:hypothetical protein
MKQWLGTTNKTLWEGHSCPDRSRQECRSHKTKSVLLGALNLTTAVFLANCAFAGPVELPAGVDHAPYDRLLQKYVNDRGLVDYRAWKGSAEDLQALRDYTAQFAGNTPFATGHEKAAGLINAYNALTLQWILDHYPVKSIKATSNPWGAKRWPVGGRQVSLDEIEHDTLRPQFGYRVHAVLVCAAKSCPPLWNHAYDAGQLDGQLDDAMRRWLARDDLNRFLPVEKRMELSKIFSWYGKDFDDLPAMLARYAPVQCPDCRVSYRSYDWALNEQ